MQISIFSSLEGLVNRRFCRPSRTSLIRVTLPPGLGEIGIARRYPSVKSVHRVFHSHPCPAQSTQGLNPLWTSTSPAEAATHKTLTTNISIYDGEISIATVSCAAIASVLCYVQCFAKFNTG